MRPALRRGYVLCTDAEEKTASSIWENPMRRFGSRRLAAVALLPLVAIATFSLAQETPPSNGGKKVITEDGGQPVGNNQNSRTAGPGGPVLLDNFNLIQRLARFDRERIPERVVHARGVGAHGEFVSYGNLSDKTKAKLFSEKGKKTPVFVRFSTVIHPSGSPESLRDPRGFATKFYTEEGNWDLVGNNLPVFFIRDAIKFPDMVHSLKPSPVTNQQDPNRFFDFFSHIPESTHMLTFVFSDMGTPRSLREMDGFGVHAFKMVNGKGDVTYVKFNWRSMQGVHNYSAEEAAQAAAKNHSFHTADLYDNIRAGKFPEWELRVQYLKPTDLDKFDFDPLDDTKIWTNIPEEPVGKMTLNRIPDNFFQFSEQSAFAPGMMIPGIEASEDKMLQGRLFSYADTQRYRVGTNYLMLPVNKPRTEVSNSNQDGQGNFGVTKGEVNYEPSITSGGRRDESSYELAQTPIQGNVQQKPIKKQLNFAQAGELYRSFSDAMKTNLIKNLSGDLNAVKNNTIKTRMVAHFYLADQDYGTRLAKATNVELKEVQEYAKTLETK
jgi:catalase